MRTCEIFELPGQSTPDQVMASFAPAPRTLTLVGMRAEVAIRVLCYLLCLAFASIVVLRFFDYYIENAEIFAWFAIVLVAPLAIIGLPWCLSVGLKKRRQTFEKCRAIYENGVLAKGEIVMLSLVMGNDYACYYAKRSFWAQHLPQCVRVDYTFNVNNELKVGSVFIHEKNARYLATNDEICVLYDPEHPENNMLYPLPGEELCGFCVKTP